MSRSVWFLHHQDLLDHPAQVQGDRPPAEGALWRRGPGGAGASVAAPPALLSAAEGGSGVSEARRHGPGLPGALTELLRGGHGHGQHRDAGQAVQQQLDPDGQLRRPVLWPGLRRTAAHAHLAVQLQVPLVLLRQVQHVQREIRSFHLQVRKEEGKDDGLDVFI